MVEWSSDDDGSVANEPVQLTRRVAGVAPVRSSDVTAAAEQIGRLICERDQYQREIVMLRVLLSRLPEDNDSGSETIDTSPEGVKASIDRTLDHLANHRVSPDQRRDLTKATERADRVTNDSDTGLRRAIR